MSFGSCPCARDFTFSAKTILTVRKVVPLSCYSGAETWDMAAGNTICLPEPLEDGDAKSWFRRFDVCATANE